MTESEQTYRVALLAFLARDVVPYVEEWERSQFFPRDIVRSLGQAGFFAPCLRSTAYAQAIPLDIRFFSILIEELAKTRCFGLTLTISIHVGVFLPLVQRLAQPSIRDRLLAAAIRGDVLGTIAITEAGSAGSDFMGIESCAEFQPDRIVLSGHKYYITNAAVADYVVVFARHLPGRHFTNFCALLTPTDLPGVRSARLEMAVMQTAVISEIEFNQVVLDPSALLGRKQLGMSYFLQHIAVERLSGGIWAAAVAEQCLEQAQRMAVSRQIGAETLWERSSVRHQIAQAVAQVTLLRALVEKIVAEMDRSGIVDPFQSAVLKATVAPMMEQVIGLCLQLQGARGLTAQSALLRLLNEFRVFGVAGGSVETMLDVISDGWAQRAMHATDEHSTVSVSALVSLT